MNTLIAIYPYKYQGFWVFDDPKVGLVQEPFVSGADVIIDHMASRIPNAEEGFRLLFSAGPFPGFTAELEWRRADLGGNWYYSRQLNNGRVAVPRVTQVFRGASEADLCEV